MSILVLNGGSSSLKFGLYDGDTVETIAEGLLDWSGGRDRAEMTISPAGAAPIREQREIPHGRAAVACILQALRSVGQATDSHRPPSKITVVGQRVVHGGTKLRASVVVDAEVKAEIGRLAELAPLHNPVALEAIEATEAELPGVPQVAVFDTSFYASLSPAQHVYPLPWEWYAEWGIRRFGFHGISHEYCGARASELLGRGSLRVVACHLGNGCSATAMRDGAAVATTMGFTPLDGLMMGTRAGALDPGILTYVQRQKGLTAEQLEDVLNHGAGLAGVSGVSSDYRAVEAAAGKGNERARLALEIHSSRIRQAVGSLAATLGGIDVLLFTAGIGERSVSLRSAVCDGLGFLGVALDPGKNAACQPDMDVAAAGSNVRVLVVRTREEWMIARAARRLVA